MKESVGYTVILNIVITFIIIVFAFLSAALIYFKSNKVSNIITSAIEKYEGYNSLAETEITSKLSSLGYNKKSIHDKCAQEPVIEGCTFIATTGNTGYCVYFCSECQEGEPYYYYKIRTNMMLNIPIVNNLLDIPIFSNTNRLYDFSGEACAEDVEE